MQIGCQRPAAAQLIRPGWILPDKNLLCFRRDAKISGKFFCGVFEVDAEQPCGKVDDITAGSAAEAEELVFIQLHAGVHVLVKWAAGHAVSAHCQPVVFGSLCQGDSCLYTFKYFHFLIS